MQFLALYGNPRPISEALKSNRRPAKLVDADFKQLELRVAALRGKV